MNTGFYKDLDTNFEQALIMSEREFSHDELIELLENGNIPQKQIAAMKFDRINTQKDADILVKHLTGCDGKIREAVALSINRFLVSNPECAKFFHQAEIFAKASIDINANICRLVIDSIEFLKEDKDFAGTYLSMILGFIDEAFAELDKFVFRDKKYVINKQLFKLYWSLESLKLFVNEVNKDMMLKILEKASRISEYTIREKAAMILNQLASEEFSELRERLRNDENYYVRNAFGAI